MSLVILLDAGPLGLITNPRASQETRDCNLWLESLVLKEVQVKIPEIADYEVRRELLRADKFKGINRLDDLEKYPIRYDDRSIPIRCCPSWVVELSPGLTSGRNI